MTLEVLTGRHSDAVEDVGYRENVEFEAAECYSGCLVLTVERGDCMDDVLEVGTCRAEVRCCEL